MNTDKSNKSGHPKSLNEKEIAELKAIAFMYHSRGKSDEAAAIFELIDKMSGTNSSKTSEIANDTSEAS
ncbi:MAG: hypothetical protein U0105_16515 [Candidatus Obscuribacterales bacterium]